MKKTCVISGGSSGIGLSIVKKFLQENFQVFNLDIQPSKICHYLECDMRNYAQVVHNVKDIGNKYPIDVLVPNAGIHLFGNIEQTSLEDFNRVFEINVKGAYALTQAAIPFMKQQKSGAVVFMASDQALIGKTNSFAYNLSKSAIASMAKTTALDYATFNIRANAVCPGTIDTQLYQKAISDHAKKTGIPKHELDAAEAALQPLRRIGKPEEVAELVFFLASEKAKFITGSLYSIDGGYTAK